MAVLMKSNTITALPHNGLNKDLHYELDYAHKRRVTYNIS